MGKQPIVGLIFAYGILALLGCIGMRTTTGQQDAVLASKHAGVHARVTLNSIEVTDYKGYNWLQRITIEHDVDKPHGSAVVTTARKIFDWSLVGIIEVADELLIETAVMPGDAIPQSGDWVEVFRGNIDAVEFSGESVTFSARDTCGELSDAFVETIEEYGTLAGRDIELVAQDILDDHASTWTLYSPNGTGGTPFDNGDSPSFLVKQYYQSKMRVMHAMRGLWGIIGWDVRCRWHDNTSAFQMVATSVNRTSPTSQKTLTNADYYAVESYEVNRADVRNAVRVTYDDATSGRSFVTSSDSASITKYGRRYMELTEDDKKLIDSSGEATALADLIVNDLKEPIASVVVSMPYFWPAELNDYYTLEANNDQITSDTDLAVKSIRHTITPSNSVTLLTLEGNPKYGVKSWLQLEGLPGIAPAIDDKTDNAPDNATVVALLGGIAVSYDDPRAMTPPVSDWAYTEVHVSTSSGFTPGSSTLKAKGKQTRFEIFGLKPNTTHYVKLVIVDEAGNESTISTQVNTDTARWGASNANLNSDYSDNLVWNGDFAVWTPPLVDTDDPPDNWVTVEDSTPDESLWGSSNQVYFSTSQHRRSNVSLHVSHSENAKNYGVQTEEMLPIDGGKVYLVDAWMRKDQAGATAASVRFDFFEADKSTTTGSIILLFNASSPDDTWIHVPFIRREDDDSRFVRVRALGSTGTPSGDVNIYIDAILIRRQNASFSAYLGSAQTGVATSTTTQVEYGSISHNYGQDYVGSSDYEYTAREDGPRAFYAQVEFSQLADGAECYLSIYVNSVEAVQGPVMRNTTGGAADMHPFVKVESIELDRDDVVDVRIWHDNGSDRQINPGSALSFFSGVDLFV